MTPFLKWAGGKRWLAKHLVQCAPHSYNRYIEPFLGSGAVFFELKPKSALLSDINESLVTTFIAVRDHPVEVEERLNSLHLKHNKDFYYFMRSSAPTDPIEIASRFIYLNRTCWNGLYRVNKRNEFNVPIGSKSSVILPGDDFSAVAELLNSAEIRCGDFESIIDSAVEGDFLYVDPPYTVKHNLNGFLKYNQTMFSWDDQVRLKDALVRAKARGCNLFVSNADHESVRELYSGFAFSSLPRSSVISGSAMYRGKTTELFVTHHG